MSGDREKVVAALATKAGVEGYCNISALKTYFYEAYDAGRRAGLEEAAKKVEHFLDVLTPEEHPPHGLYEAAKRWDSGHSESFVKVIAGWIRSLADGGQK